MKTFRIGPTLIVNARVKTANNKGKEDNNMLEKFPAPPVVNSFKNDAEEYVKRWYKDCEKQPIVQANETAEAFAFVPPPPPCILGIKEEEK